MSPAPPLNGSAPAAPAPVLTDAQQATLWAILDVVFRSHDGEEADEILASLPKDSFDWQKAKARAMVTSSFSSLPYGPAIVLAVLENALSPTVLAETKAGLDALATRAGMLILTGWYATPFHELSVDTRTQILKDWSTSTLETRRKLFRGFTLLALMVAYISSDDVIEAVGYPATGDPNVHLKPPKTSPERHVHSFAQPSDLMETEVLIIGSGSGGGVAAAEIAAKGHKVLVVEQGNFYPLGALNGTQIEGLSKLYLSGGPMVTEDGSMSVLAARTFGGGSFVNWSASLRTPKHVRENWATVHKLPYFATDGFTKSLDAVCGRMGVSPDHLEHNYANQALMDACDKLGNHGAAIPQNTNSAKHACGFCSFGCPYGEKQGSTETWLVDAQKAGAEFILSHSVDRLLFSTMSSKDVPTLQTLDAFSYSTARTRCVGALLLSDSGERRIVYASKSVCLSGGSVCSPAVLIRSGLKNPNIGQNLHLHPCSYISGFFEENIKPWSGAIMTAVSNVVPAVGSGLYSNVKLEVLMSWPGGTAASSFPWKGSKEHKKLMLKYNHSFSLISLTKDRDGGKIVVDANGNPRIDYTLSKRDGLANLEGVIAGCEVFRAAGANVIVTAQINVDPFERVKGESKESEDARWESWIGKVRKAGILPSWANLGSAHQMSSNIMGVSSKTSVVNPRGRVWDTESLYVADASVFPTASGVNPMITTMACAHSIANFLCQDLAAGGL